jgi:hypothetical protein
VNLQTTCVLCRAPGVHGHHATGRPGPRGAYFDRALVVPVCRPCHVALHAGLRRSGLAWPTRGNELRHRLGRVADLCARVADARRGLVLDERSTRALGALLVEAAVALGQGRKGAA